MEPYNFRQGLGMSSSKLVAPFLGGTRKSIVMNLLGKDANSVELAKKIGINESAIRRHLETLEKEGLVISKFQRFNKGRPKKIFSLTAYGKAVFPRKSKEVLSFLARKITQRYGEEEMELLMSSVAKDFAETFMPKEMKGDLESRLGRLVQLLNDYGFFASLSKDWDKYIVEYRNCVFEDIIPQFGTYICKIDEDMVKKIAGDADIRWMSRIAKGDRKCIQIISKSGTANQRDRIKRDTDRHKYEFTSPNTLQNGQRHSVHGGN
jgi:predicted ArsR family transcriptional regulator